MRKHRYKLTKITDLAKHCRYTPSNFIEISLRRVCAISMAEVKKYLSKTVKMWVCESPLVFYIFKLKLNNNFSWSFLWSFESGSKKTQTFARKHFNQTLKTSPISFIQKEKNLNFVESFTIVHYKENENQENFWKKICWLVSWLETTLRWTVYGVANWNRRFQG